MDKLTFKEWSILADLETIAPLGEDFEFSMARGELKTAKSAINRLMKHLNGEGDLEAWVQSKITKAAEYLDTVADHMDGGEDDTERTKEVKEGFKGHKSVEEIAKKHKVSPSVIEKQLEMGMKVEKEHTTDNDQAMDIALQHLDEVPNYYSKLKKVEKVKEDWSEKYKKSIDCDNPKGFSQKAHCQGRKKEMNEAMSPHEEATERSKEKLKKEKKITTAPMMMPRNAVYQPKPDPIKDTSVKEQPKPKPKAEEKKEPLTPLQAAKLRKLEREQKKKGKKLRENQEIFDAEGNLFATVIDIIKGSDYKFKSFTQPITEDAVKELEIGLKKLDNTSYDSIDKLMRRIMKEHGVTAKELHNAFVDKNGKTPDDWVQDLEESTDGIKAKDYKGRLDRWFDDGGWVQAGGKYDGKPCAKQPGQTTKPYCRDPDDRASMNKDERNKRAAKKRREDPNPNRSGAAKIVTQEGAGEKDACYSKVKSRYKVWPSAYASGALVKCRKVGAANWGNKTKKEEFELQEMGEIQRYCPKCQKNETASECRYGEGYWRMFSLPASLAPEKPYSIAKVHPANESIIYPGQITNEDYQRIQSTGNVYTILFSWRGRPMMNLQLFFPNMKRPSKDEVKAQIEKLYPGAVIMQWYPSPTDPSKPIVVIQGN